MECLPRAFHIGFTKPSKGWICTPITNSPTKMKVVYAAFYRALGIMNELDIELIFLELDQTIYTIFKMKQKYLKLFYVWVVSLLVFGC